MLLPLFPPPPAPHNPPPLHARRHHKTNPTPHRHRNRSTHHTAHMPPAEEQARFKHAERDGAGEPEEGC